MDRPLGAIHGMLSSKVFLPLLRLQQAIRPDRQLVARAYRDGMRMRAMAATWSDEQKRNWILTRMRFAVRRANDDVPYYRELFRGVGFDPHADFGFDEFAQLPVLERTNISQAGKALLSESIPASALRRDSSGGSTGMPTHIWRGGEEEGWNESGREYFNRLIGLPAGSRTGMLWGHHLDPVASDGFQDRLQTFLFNRRWFDCFRLSPDVLDRYHRDLEAYQPACILAYASALGHLAEHVLERGYRPRYPTRCFVTGAEKLLPAHRATIEQAFHRPIHERYGSRDVGPIGFQLKPSESLAYTLDWANMLVEPETDEPHSDILVTKLHADGMPMIRYRVGDMGQFPLGSRPGQPTFSLGEILGRSVDRIWLSAGRWIHGNQLPHMLKDYPIREFVFLQRSDYSIELQLVPRSGFSDDHRRHITETVSANVPGLSVTTVLVNEIPKTKAGKWRPVVSQIEQTGRPA